MSGTPRLRRLLATGGAVAGALVVVLVAGPAAAVAGPATQALPAHPRYVALGDSYTAGPLIPWQRLDPLGCLRSTANYPHKLADALHTASYTDVSCSGADTTNMTTKQSVVLGSNAPQFDALSADTDLVTVGIGGNDFGVFGDITSTCPELRASDPTGAPCRDHYTDGGVDSLKQKIDKTGDRVAGVVRGVRQHAPHATILVIGYPRIAPTSGYCPDVLPFADGDYRYLDGIEEYLNAAIERGTRAAGGRFVDTYPASSGHDACATGGAAWINGQHLTLTAAPYHPNAAGMVGLASIVADYLAGADLLTAPVEARR